MQGLTSLHLVTIPFSETNEPIELDFISRIRLKFYFLDLPSVKIRVKLRSSSGGRPKRLFLFY